MESPPAPPQQDAVALPEELDDLLLVVISHETRAKATVSCRFS